MAAVLIIKEKDRAIRFYFSVDRQQDALVERAAKHKSEYPKKEVAVFDADDVCLFGNRHISMSAPERERLISEMAAFSIGSAS